VLGTSIDIDYELFSSMVQADVGYILHNVVYRWYGRTTEFDETVSTTNGTWRKMILT